MKLPLSYNLIVNSWKSCNVECLCYLTHRIECSTTRYAVILSRVLTVTQRFSKQSHYALIPYIKVFSKYFKSSNNNFVKYRMQIKLIHFNSENRLFLFLKLTSYFAKQLKYKQIIQITK
jgi:hypothetical protein